MSPYAYLPMLTHLVCHHTLTYQSSIKDRYESVDDAMSTVIDVYVENLVALTKPPHNFRVFVHPVAPVLDATRHLCLRFNAMLKPRVESAIGSRRPLHWLQFVDDLLVEKLGAPNAGAKAGKGKGKGKGKGAAQQYALRSELRLDGTHLAPAYLPLVEAELARLEF